MTIIVDLSTRTGIIQALKVAASQVQHEYPVTHATIEAAIHLLETEYKPEDLLASPLAPKRVPTQEEIRRNSWR